MISEHVCQLSLREVPFRTAAIVACRAGSDERASASSHNGDMAEARLVRTWVASLPERQRLTVYLRYYADLDYEQIATVVDVAVGTVFATLGAAHRSLRKTIEEVPQ